MPRLLLICLLLVSLAVPSTALAQGGGAFGPLPPAAPEPTPVPTRDPALTNDDDVSRQTLYIIGGGLLLLFLGIGYVITRDAKRVLPEDRLEDRPRDAGPHKHEQHAKAKARAKQRQARKARKTTKKVKKRS
jgi:hypothetical protein